MIRSTIEEIYTQGGCHKAMGMRNIILLMLHIPFQPILLPITSKIPNRGIDFFGHQTPAMIAFSLLENHTLPADNPFHFLI